MAKSGGRHGFVVGLGFCLSRKGSRREKAN
jgi:hypothetical protein